MNELAQPFFELKPNESLVEETQTTMDENINETTILDSYMGCFINYIMIGGDYVLDKIREVCGSSS